MVGENTHLSGLGGDVDLDDILGLVDGLLRQLARVRFARICDPVHRGFWGRIVLSSVDVRILISKGVVPGGGEPSSA